LPKTAQSPSTKIQASSTNNSRIASYLIYVRLRERVSKEIKLFKPFARLCAVFTVRSWHPIRLRESLCNKTKLSRLSRTLCAGLSFNPQQSLFICQVKMSDDFLLTQSLEQNPSNLEGLSALGSNFELQYHSAHSC